MSDEGEQTFERLGDAVSRILARLADTIRDRREEEPQTDD